MKRKIIIPIIMLLMIVSACASKDILKRKESVDSKQIESGDSVSDSQVAEQISEIQQLVKIGSKKDDVILELSDKYESFELYNPSGDSYNEAYLFAPKSEQHLFEVRTGDNFDNGLIHGNIEKIEGDSFWIENHNEEMSIEYNIYNDLIAFRNYFLSSRKIGMTVKIFFDQENLVSQVWIEFVYGEKNAIHSLHLSQDGRIVLKLEDNITY
ncbi:MAG: hypothetical protein CVV02_12435 [Firmicutes bacterium HGW-Firmicutes-7]|nr:MAG: hypothetical protein CVV02_12435 [Firmicutes bacterium HGW-Firmicutes-7]